MGVVAAAMAVLLVAVGCSSEAAAPKVAQSDVSYQRLKSSAKDDGPCPVGLDAAAAKVGLSTDAAATGMSEVTPAVPAKRETDPKTAKPVEVPAQAAGVFMVCHLELADGAQLDLSLNTSEGKAAGVLLGPTILAKAKMSLDGVKGVIEELRAAKAGQPVDLPNDTQAASVMATGVSGATSAALILTGSAGLTTETLDDVARMLDAELH